MRRRIRTIYQSLRITLLSIDQRTYMMGLHELYLTLCPLYQLMVVASLQHTLSHGASLQQQLCGGVEHGLGTAKGLYQVAGSYRTNAGDGG